MRFGEKQEGKVKVTLNNVRISCNNIVALLRALYIEVSCHRLRAAPGACLWLCMVSHFVRCRYATFYKESVFEKLAELVDDLRSGEGADAEVGEPDVFTALREAYVELSFVLLHERIERINDPCALHIVATGEFALVDLHDGQMVAVFW